MTIVVKRKGEVTGRDVLGFRLEWLETWKEWVVIHGLVAYSSWDDENEARKMASLLEKVTKTIADIEDYAESVLKDLTAEERKFLRDYCGDTITIEV